MFRGVAVLEVEWGEDWLARHLSGSLSSQRLGISWKLSSGLEGSGTAASAVFSDH